MKHTDGERSNTEEKATSRSNEEDVEGAEVLSYRSDQEDELSAQNESGLLGKPTQEMPQVAEAAVMGPQVAVVEAGH